MTLNEAIEYYDSLAEKCRRKASIERNDYMDLRDESAEYSQLSEWLAELEVLREKVNCSELPNSSDLVSRSYLLAEYDRQHQGPPGGARKIIEEAPPVQAEQKWIPCKKKLPEESNTYIATLIDDGGYFTDVVEWNSTFGGRWQSVFYDDSPIGEYHDISNVIAWQPLPEPYRGDTDE